MKDERDVKPKKEPVDIVEQPNASIHETETIKGPSPNFPEVVVHTTRPVSEVQEGGFDWKSDGGQTIPRVGCEADGKNDA